MSFVNKSKVSEARDAIRSGKPLPSAALRGSTREMPKEGKELIDMGYKFHSVGSILSGVTDWYFALPEVAVWQ